MFPEELIENFIKDYSEKDKANIQKDLKIIEELIFEDLSPSEADNLTYVASAGGPGSGKSTTLEAYLDFPQKKFAYLDPDQKILLRMLHTYLQELTVLNYAKKSTHTTLDEAYKHWRWASNFITHVLMERAFGGHDGTDPKYSVAHGTTSTSPHVATLYSNLKERGYRITLLLCYCEDDVRQKAIEIREKEQAFVQVDPKEVVSKGVEFPKRFDTYFEYADELFFYWNNKMLDGQLPSPCAKWVRSDPGYVMVIDRVEWTHFCSKYAQDILRYDLRGCDRFMPLIPKKCLLTPDQMLESGSFISDQGLFGKRAVKSESEFSSDSENEEKEAMRVFESQKLGSPFN